MKTSDILKRLVAGIFFIASIILVIVIVFVIGIERGLTQPKFQMTVLFRTVGGLTIGAPVRLSGVTVGTVAGIDFLKDEVSGRGVKAELSLYSKYKEQVYKSIKVAIITEGVLGEKIVEITTAPHFRMTDLEQPIIGEDPLDVQTLAETFGEAAVSFKETSKTIDAITRDMRDISITTRRILNRAEEKLVDGTLFKLF